MYHLRRKNLRHATRMCTEPMGEVPGTAADHPVTDPVISRSEQKQRSRYEILIDCVYRYIFLTNFEMRNGRIILAHRLTK